MYSTWLEMLSKLHSERQCCWLTVLLLLDLRDMFMHTLSGYNKIQIIILNKRAMDVSLNGPFAAMLKVHSSSKKKTALKKQKWFIF